MSCYPSFIRNSARVSVTTTLLPSALTLKRTRGVTFSWAEWILYELATFPPHPRTFHCYYVRRGVLLQDETDDVLLSTLWPASSQVLRMLIVLGRD